MAQLVSAGILYIQGCRFKSCYPDQIGFVDINKNMYLDLGAAPNNSTIYKYNIRGWNRFDSTQVRLMEKSIRQLNDDQNSRAEKHMYAMAAW